MMLQESLKRLRSELGYSQTELAQVLQVSFTTINRWENGKVVPNEHVAKNVVQLVEKMDVTPSCMEYIKKAFFPEEDKKVEKVRRLDMNMAGQLVDDSSTGIFVMDCDTYELLYLNKTMEKMSARNGKAKKGMTCYGYIHGLDMPCRECKECGCLSHKNRDEFSEREFTSDTGHHYLMKGRHIRWEGKNAFVQYISDESSMLEEQSAIKNLLNRVPGGLAVYEVNEAGVINLTYLNDGFYPLVESNRADWGGHLGKDTFYNAHPSDRVKLVRAFQCAFAENKSILEEVRIKLIDGRYKWFRAEGTVAEHYGNRAILYMMYTDIDEAKQAELSLLAYTRAVSQAVESGETAFWSYNPETKVLIQMGEVATAFGYPTVVKNMPDKEYYLRLHNQKSLLAMFESGETEKTYETQVMNEEGDAVWGRNTMHLIMDPVNEHVILYEYVYDINTEKMMGEFLNILLMHGYEACGWLNVDEGKYTSLNIEPNTGRITTTVQSCEEAGREFANKFISAEERDNYIINMIPEKIYEEALDKKPIMNRIMENGTVHYIRGNAYVVDPERKVCFLTRMDVTDSYVKEEEDRKALEVALKDNQRTNAVINTLAHVDYEHIVDIDIVNDTYHNLATPALDAILEPCTTHSYSGDAKLYADIYMVEEDKKDIAGLS